MCVSEDTLSIFILIFAAKFFKKILFIHERHRERQRQRQREKQAPCREPNVGLDPRTPGSRSEPKAGAQPLSPLVMFFDFKNIQLRAGNYWKIQPSKSAKAKYKPLVLGSV